MQAVVGYYHRSFLLSEVVMKILWTLFAITIIAYAAEVFFRYKVTKSMTELLQQREYELYDQVRYGKITMFTVPQVNLLYFDLTKAILKDDIRSADKLMEVFKTKNMTRKQKESIYCRAFYFYLANKQYEQASMCHEEIMKDADPASQAEIDLLYHVYVLKDDLYLEDLLIQFGKADTEQKTDIAGLLAEIYNNKNDTENYNKYLSIVKKELSEEKGD